MSTQYSLDWSQKRPPEVQARIADGMEKADQNADGRWRHMVDAAIVACARKLAEVTVDEVIEEMGGIKNCPTTHALDALGPAMCRAARMGILKSTNRVIRSKRPEAHGNRHTVWTSNYYQPKEKQ